MFPEDARHWIAVYRHMVGFKHNLLGRMRAELRRLPVAAMEDVLENDVALIEAQLHRYERRLEFWYSRHWQLEGLDIDLEARTVGYRDQSVSLTRREFQLLMMLVERSPHYVSPTQLLADAWHDPGLPEETLRTYIVRLRAKISRLGVTAKILNRRRQGYALVFEDWPPGSWRGAPD